MRKKLTHTEALTHDIKLRVNQFHFDRLNTLLKETHHRTMSELLREIICQQKLTLYTKDNSIDLMMPELIRIRKELNAIGSNINQIARQLHSATDKFKIALLATDATHSIRETQQIIRNLLSLISELAKKWLKE